MKVRKLGQIDVIPAERRQPAKARFVDSDTLPAKISGCAAKIAAVE
jgi:hypothetical protein